MKKIINVLLCTAMLMCSVTGCKADNKSNVDSKAEQSQSIEYETIKPPEDGWTKQQLFDTVYICDNNINLPVNIKSLGEDFKFDQKSIKVNESKHYAKAELLFKDKFLGNVRIENVDRESDIDDNSSITSLVINSETCEVKSCEPVVVNGAKLENMLDEVLKNMGDNYDKNGYVYSFKETGSEKTICILVFKNNSLFTVDFKF